MGAGIYLHRDGSGLPLLVATVDWHSRYVLAWNLSSTLEIDCCVAALEQGFLRSQPVKVSLVNRLP